MFLVRRLSHAAERAADHRRERRRGAHRLCRVRPTVAFRRRRDRRHGGLRRCSPSRRPAGMSADPMAVLLILTLGVATYGTRIAGHLSSRASSGSNPRVEAALDAVPVAVITALVAPAVLARSYADTIAAAVTIIAALQASDLADAADRSGDGFAAASGRALAAIGPRGGAVGAARPPPSWLIGGPCNWRNRSPLPASRRKRPAHRPAWRAHPEAHRYRRCCWSRP